jgi:glycosyltransferase involved in cell wall biosynthesis
VLLRGHHANVADLRPWEHLTDRFDVLCVVTRRTAHGVADLGLPKLTLRTRRDLLPRGRLGELAARVPGDRYLGLADVLADARIVHSAELGPWFSGQPAELKRRLGFRLVLTVWETIPFRETYRTFRARAYRAATIPEVDLFLPTTERARDCLLLEGVPAERIEVSPPGIELARFSHPRVPDRGPPLVVSPGRLVWEKGHQDVLRAVAALSSGLIGERREVRLLVVGQGPEETRLRRYAADLGIAERVEIRAVPYAEMPAVFAAASCVVLASLPLPHWEEQFGMVLAEAMAAGVPVVASASGAIPEVLGAGGTLFRPGDWLQLARVLADTPAAKHDPQLVRRYSSEAAADRLAAAYDRVLL